MSLLFRQNLWLRILHFFVQKEEYYCLFPYFCSRFVVSFTDSIGNRVRIPDSSRCCVGYNACHERHWKPCLSGRRQEKTSVRRPASSHETRLPGIGAGILYLTRYALHLGTIFILGIPTFFQRFWGNKLSVKPIETILCIINAFWVTKTTFWFHVVGRRRSRLPSAFLVL